jgi:hypothetical protein
LLARYALNYWERVDLWGNDDLVTWLITYAGLVSQRLADQEWTKDAHPSETRPGVGIELVRAEFARVSSKRPHLPIFRLEFYCSQLGTRLHLDQSCMELLSVLVRANISEPVKDLVSCRHGEEGRASCVFTLASFLNCSTADVEAIAQRSRLVHALVSALDSDIRLAGQRNREAYVGALKSDIGLLSLALVQRGPPARR